MWGVCAGQTLVQMHLFLHLKILHLYLNTVTLVCMHLNKNHMYLDQIHLIFQMRISNLISVTVFLSRVPRSHINCLTNTDTVLLTA